MPDRPRLLILLPGGQPHRLKLGARYVSFREAPLTGTLLAALVPPELGFAIEYVDGSVSPIPLDRRYDLVAISLITGMALQGYALADEFRRRGAAVVLGGIHVSLRPDEARQHADAIVVGFAEESWPQLLRDWCAGQLQREYRAAAPPSLRGLPSPRRELQRRFAYAAPQTVFATRGCRQACDFCVAPAVPLGWQVRPVDEVIAEIRALPGPRFVFNDLNLTDDRDYAAALFAALRPLRKHWGGLASTKVAREPALLDAMAASGCDYLLLGFESLSRQALGGMHKGFNAPEEYAAVCQALHQRGIVIQGCFIFGLDADTPAVFAETVALVDELGIDIPRYALYTPFPGTHAYQRLTAEGRMLHEDWRYYDTQHVVIRPRQMSPRELDDGFRWAWRQSFRTGAVLRRLRRTAHPAITLTGNLAYRLYARRLARDADRFPARCPEPGAAEVLQPLALQP
jgi:radical SAM superfamily enzyme YgiQ (UPF0313 family)